MAAMDRVFRRQAGNVDRMRRFGIRPVDFVRAAERDLAGPLLGGGRSRPRRPAGVAVGEGESSARRALANCLGSLLAPRRAKT
jgi:hypothetical protein